MLCQVNIQNFFNKKGELKHITDLRLWSLKNVLLEKYHFKESDAQEFSDFLVPLLAFNPKKRVSAFDALKHPWVQPENMNNGHYVKETSNRSNMNEKKSRNSGQQRSGVNEKRNCEV